MAANQPTLFDVPGLICLTPTRSYPDGRRGTPAGYRAHWKASEDPCPECREAQRLITKTYREKNKEYVYQQRKDYREQHKEEISADMRARYLRDREQRILKIRAYEKAHPEKAREWRITIDSRRRFRLKGLPTEHYTLNQITEAHGTTCYLCGTEVDLSLPPGLATSPQIDHLHPIAREGCPGDILSNCRWTHAQCNKRKSARLVSELELPFPAP